VKSRISSKGQVTVPLEVREQLGLVPGTAVEFLVREGEAVLRKDRQTREPVDRVYGMLAIEKAVDALIDEMRGPRPARRRLRRAGQRR
jgi:AbrB family looped-hinge helix DNA binding protein